MGRKEMLARICITITWLKILSGTWKQSQNNGIYIKVTTSKKLADRVVPAGKHANAAESMSWLLSQRHQGLLWLLCPLYILCCEPSCMYVLYKVVNSKMWHKSETVGVFHNWQDPGSVSLYVDLLWINTKLYTV